MQQILQRQSKGRTVGVRGDVALLPRPPELEQRQREIGYDDDQGRL